jgi:rod shape-determining protein MreD
VNVARRQRFSWLRILVLILAALVATVAPLPELLEPARPNFVALTVLWLCLASLRATGLAVAWGAGLAEDALHGMLLGQHALALVVIAYIALKLRFRIRVFPALHQSTVVLALLALHEFILFWIDGLSGHALTGWGRWLSVFVGAACWPLLSALLGRLALRH